MGIHIGGLVNTGLPPNIVEQIMDAERIPLKTLETKKAKENDHLKLVGELETKVTEVSSHLGELVGTKGFTDSKVVSGDPAVVDGIIDPKAAVQGSWTVEVMQLAQKPGAISNGFPDRDTTEIGVGYFKFDTPQGQKEVYLDGKNSTLDKVAATINSANVGVRAQVINDRKDKENPFRLIITGLATGDDKQVGFPSVYLLDGDQDFFFETKREAQNGRIKLDGFEMEVPDNTIKDAIPGMTLDIKQAAPGRPIGITVKDNLEVIVGKVKGFVDAMNGVFGFIQGQHKLVKGPGGKEQMGPLGGDGLLRTLESSFHRLVQNPQRGISGPINRLSQLGIEFNRNGSLNFNSEKFTAAVTADPGAAAEFFRGDGFSVGLVPSVRREVSNQLNSVFGPIANRKRGLQDKVDSVNKRIETKERQLEKKEEALRRQFSNLDAKMSQIQQQSAALAGAGIGR